MLKRYLMPAPWRLGASTDDEINAVTSVETADGRPPRERAGPGCPVSAIPGHYVQDKLSRCGTFT